MCEDVVRRASEVGKVGRTVQLSIGYRKEVLGGGFSRSRTIEEETNETLNIYRVCQNLFYEFHQDKPVGQIS